MSKVKTLLKMKLIGAAVLFCLGLGFGLYGSGLFDAVRLHTVPPEQGVLRVYCAAGIRKPVEAAAKEFEKEFGVVVRIDYGSSGELEGKLAFDAKYKKSRADVYIPADMFFARRAKSKDLTMEMIPLATFKLVLAAKSKSALVIENINDLLSPDVNYVLCDEQAGVGKKTKGILTKSGHWAAINKGKKATFPRVTETCSAIKLSTTIHCGFVWDTTAKQFGLRIVPLKALEKASSQISANLVSSTQQSQLGLKFMRYLASPEKGNGHFKRYHFSPVQGDQWAEIPRLVFYGGGVNRLALAKTLRDFEAREGCVLREQFAGCGTLVAGMKAIKAGERKMKFPDLYMTCDASFMTMMATDFKLAKDVTTTDIVMLVRAGNPHHIKTVSDLAQENLAVGTTDPRMSTLGKLSWHIFSDVGVEAALKRNVIVTVPTAHELILQMEGHHKLDVVLVYRVNVAHLKGQYEVIKVDHPLAKARQNIAISNGSPYSQLSKRLLERVFSNQSRKRFEKEGFNWLGNMKQPK